MGPEFQRLKAASSMLPFLYPYTQPTSHWAEGYLQQCWEQNLSDSFWEQNLSDSLHLKLPYLHFWNCLQTNVHRHCIKTRFPFPWATVENLCENISLLPSKELCNILTEVQRITKCTKSYIHRLIDHFIHIDERKSVTGSENKACKSLCSTYAIDLGSY